MAKQTEQVILPVIIIAITRHEGLVMDLLILHAEQRQPLCLSKGGGGEDDDVCVFPLLLLFGRLR